MKGSLSGPSVAVEASLCAGHAGMVSPFPDAGQPEMNAQSRTLSSIPRSLVGTDSAEAWGHIASDLLFLKLN